MEGRIASLAFQSVGELLFGAHRAKWGPRRFDELRTELSKYVVIPFRIEMVEHYARIYAESGFPPGQHVGDAWIAATAAWAGCPILTHNRRHFERFPGIKVISES